MPALAFLFDVEVLEEHSPSSYNLQPLKSFFELLLELEAKASFDFELLQGDLLLSNLAYAPTRVRMEHKPDGSTSVATHTSGDKKLYETLIWDFCDSMEDRWHTVVSADLTASLGRTEVFALAVSDLPLEAATEIDDGLSAVEAYLGAFEIDLGNPIQRRVTAGGLVGDFLYRNGSLLFDPWHSEEPLDPPPLERHGEEWFIPLGFDEIRYMTSEEWEAWQRTTMWPIVEISPRGEQSAKVLRQRVREPHMRQLAGELAKVGIRGVAKEFDIETAVMPRASDAVVEDSKLVDYLLDPESAKGAAKARFFKDDLGIEAGDWLYLAAQLKQGLNSSRILSKVRSEQWGIRYEVITNVKGLNGSSAAILSAWQVEPGKPPRFITAHPAAKRDGLTAGTAPEPRVVPSDLDGDGRWTELWRLANEAGEAAAKAAVPTPMWVDGKAYEEGLCGWGTVTVPDARRGFARWLVRSQHGHLRQRHGAVVSSIRLTGQSADRGHAYADAFAEVLTLNGVSCSVTHNLD